MNADLYELLFGVPYGETALPDGYHTPNLRYEAAAADGIGAADSAMASNFEAEGATSANKPPGTASLFAAAAGVETRRDAHRGPCMFPFGDSLSEGATR